MGVAGDGEEAYSRMPDGRIVQISDYYGNPTEETELYLQTQLLRTYVAQLHTIVGDDGPATDVWDQMMIEKSELEKAVSDPSIASLKVHKQQFLRHAENLRNLLRPNDLPILNSYLRLQLEILYIEK